MDKKLIELVDKALTRRSFMARSGVAAAAAVVAGCGGSSTPAPTPTPTPTPTPKPSLTDADYLNFALNLEYLEAEFYLRAATGSGLSAADTGKAPSTVTVPSTTMVPGLTTAQSDYIYEIAQNELDHVRFLRSALGSAAVDRPNLDLMNSFNAAASAAGIGATFNPFASYEAFLVGAFVFEDVGVTAYHGAAGLLTDKTNLAAAASILAVEAYHAGEIRTLLIADSIATATKTATLVTPNPTYVTYAQQISKLRATLGGGNETTLTALPPYAIPFVPTAYMPASTIVAADTNSIAYARTTDQVLHIVYAAAPGAGVNGGGFFPSGMNGNISVTTS
ncbi:MAG TPA: ferritin-like domain-containing protein [Acidobacteriaceae bacterium]|nr:ferritin-like domain-containing protein [Acidobacteriaceae bacterium]